MSPSQKKISEKNKERCIYLIMTYIIVPLSEWHENKIIISYSCVHIFYDKWFSVKYFEH